MAGNSVTNISTRVVSELLAGPIVDIDECSLADGGECEQICDNTDGSYHCSCHHGYNLVGDVYCEGKYLFQY